MLSKDTFVDFILKGAAKTAVVSAGSARSALPEGFEEFDIAGTEHTSTDDTTFARRLLEAADFGLPELVARDSVIRSTDAVARYLPDRVAYWPKTPSRPYQTLLFESSLTSDELLRIPAFRRTALHHLNDAEAALARLASEALEGFQRGGETVTADVRKGRKDETLCVVSIVDTRDAEPVRLVCFGTENASYGGLETFQISEGTRFWDAQLAREHLGLLHERQFKKLAGKDWQEAFTTTEERNQAEKLLNVCTRKAPRVADIQEVVLDLLDTIAKGFGLRKKPNTERRLLAFELPPDHDIGIDPEERAGKFGGHNPFGGVTLRDERSRLLGYIIYPLKAKGDAARLREHLEANNRFHNVLVVYPDQDQASLELWQGRDQLRGKLRKGQEYKDAADIVNLLSRFFVVSKAKVRNPGDLAQELAYRARYLRRLALIELQEEKIKGPLRNLYNAFKEVLVHDQTEDDFADAFAQTITYGLLTARWLGSDQLAAAGERLTRHTALKHLAGGNPFLNDLFKSVLSVRLDEQRGRLLWLVDDIADLLDRVDVSYVFGAGDAGADKATDPVIHFYEPFLAAYDKNLKNKRGVFFTPRPVVSYIVRSVHELLQTELGIEDGLASTDTWADVTKRIDGLVMPDGVKSSDPFVQVLDPATGTGTFLYECVEVIERTLKDRWCRELGTSDWQDPAVLARWRKYVPQHLVPRLFGYELLMAPYAVAHLKIGLKLHETGYRLGSGERARIYLTNALDPASDIGQQRLTGILPALAHEAQAVNKIKMSRRFTVVVANPPYSLLSANMEAHHRAMVEVYKSVDGKRIHERGALQLEKNLNDDYVKFLRLGQVTISDAKVGVLGFVTNHSFLDNPTMRGLRWNLMHEASHIWVVDLHGNSTKLERPPDGSEDSNVFQIKQGVAITVLDHLPSHRVACEVRHHERWGTGDSKEEWLADNHIRSHPWRLLAPRPDLSLFVPQDALLRSEFEQWPLLTDVMPVHGAGYITARDNLVVDFDRDAVIDRIQRFSTSRLDDRSLLAAFEVSEKKGWDSARARSELKHVDIREKVLPTNYRPFDSRWIFFDSTLVWGRSWPTMQHLVGKSRNLSLLATRMTKDQWDVWVSRTVSSHKAMSAYDTNSVFPVYLCEDSSSQRRFTSDFNVNLSGAFLRAFPVAFGPARPTDSLPDGVKTEEVISYIYGVFFSPSYRTRYAEFLKTDFPRVPLPGSLALFRDLSSLGAELIAMHLLESPKLAKNGPEYVGGRNPEIERISWSRQTVWVDREETSGFSGIPESIWTFHVGGYQVCEKWLKERRGRTLSKRDIDQYRKIVVALGETVRLMKKIDEVIDKHGGWPAAFANSENGVN